MFSSAERKAAVAIFCFNRSVDGRAQYWRVLKDIGVDAQHMVIAMPTRSAMQQCRQRSTWWLLSLASLAVSICTVAMIDKATKSSAGHNYINSHGP